MASMNWYMGMARVARLTVSNSSTICWNSNFSSMAANGNSPP